MGGLDQDFGFQKVGLVLPLQREEQRGRQGGLGLAGEGPFGVGGVVADGGDGEGEGTGKDPVGGEAVGERAGTGGGDAAEFALA